MKREIDNTQQLNIEPPTVETTLALSHGHGVSDLGSRQARDGHMSGHEAYIGDPFLFHLPQQITDGTRLCITASLGIFTLHLKNHFGRLGCPSAMDHMGHHIT